MIRWIRTGIALRANFLGLLLFASALLWNTGLTLNAQGPKYKVEMGTRVKYKKKHGQYPASIIGANASGIYMMRAKYTIIPLPYYTIVIKKDILAKLDRNSYEVIWSKEVFDKKYSSKGKVLWYLGPYLIKGKLHAFPMVYEKKNKRVYLYHQEFDDFGEYVGKPQLLHKESVKSKKKAPDFSLRFSQDSSKVCLKVEPEKGKKSKGSYSFVVYDLGKSEMVETYEPRFKANLEDIQLEDYEVGNDGSLMIAHGERDKGAKKRKVDDTWEFFLSYYTQEGRDRAVAETAVEISGKYISGLTLAQSGDLIACSGFYSDKSSSSVTGAFHQLFDVKEKAFISQNNQDLEAKIIREFDTTKKKRKTKGEKAEENGVENIQVREVLLSQDGNTILIGEKFSWETHCVTTQSGRRCYNIYNYGDLLVTTISPEGEILQTRRVVKLQSTRAPLGKGYNSVLHQDGTLSLFFNADKKDLNKTSSGKASAGTLKHSVFKLLNILPDGEMTTQEVINYREHQKIYIAMVKSLGPETIVFLYGRTGLFAGRKQGLGMLHLQKGKR